MGVQGLWSILDSTGHPIKLEALEGRVLGVDATIWLYQFLKGFRDRDDAAKADGHKLGLFRRISKLLYYKIRPVFVFDGPAPLLKRRTLERRQETRSKSLAKAQGTALKILTEQIKQQYPNANLEQLKITLPNLVSHHLVAVNKLGDEDLEMFKLKEKSLLEQMQEEENDNDNDAEGEQWQQDWESDNSDYEFIPGQQSKANVSEKTFPKNGHPNFTFGGAQDLSKLDINSEEFKNLPAEMRHEILTDLKESRRRHKNLKSLPEEADSFSNFQLERLRVKRSVQEKIEEAEKEICTSLSTNHEFDLEFLDKKRSIVESYRVHSDPTVRMLYLKKLSEQSTAIKQDITLESGKISTKLQDVKEESFHETVEVEEKVNLTPIKASLKEFFKSTEKPDYKSIGNNLARAAEKANLSVRKSLSPKISDDDDDSNSRDSFVSVKAADADKLESEFDNSAAVLDVSDDETRISAVLNLTPSKETDNETGGAGNRSQEHTSTPVPTDSGEVLEIVNELGKEQSVEEKADPVVYHIDTDDELSIRSEDVVVSDDDAEGFLTTAKDMTSFVERLKNGTSNIDEFELFKSQTDSAVLSDFEDVAEDETAPPKKDIVILDTSDTEVDESKLPEKVDENDEGTKEGPIIDIKETTTLGRGHQAPSTRPVIYDENSSGSRSSLQHTQTQKYIMDQIEEAKRHVAASHSDASQPATTTTETKEPAADQPTTSSQQSHKQLTLEELEELKRRVNREERHANSMTNKIIRECKELLELWGIPYIVADGEAEAQCATLETLNLTEGTITDDSDVWLFGAKVVYKNFFSDHKYAMQYKMTDIEHHIRLDRQSLICIAMLVGSDYTDGIDMVGPVTALEILSEFPGKQMDPLVKFKNWWDNYKRSKDKIPGSKKRERFLKLRLPEEFPSQLVFEGYMQPCADDSDERFTWGMPKLDELREYARMNFGWDTKKVDETLLPVMQKVNDKSAQPKIDSFFFRTESSKNPALFRSKRVNKALEDLSGQSSQPSVSNNDKTKKASARGRGRGRASASNQKGTKRGRGKQAVKSQLRSVSDKGKSYLSEDETSSDEDILANTLSGKQPKQKVSDNHDDISGDSNSGSTTQTSQSSSQQTITGSQTLLLNQAPTANPRGRGRGSSVRSRARKRGAFSRAI